MRPSWINVAGYVYTHPTYLVVYTVYFCSKREAVQFQMKMIVKHVECYCKGTFMLYGRS